MPRLRGLSSIVTRLPFAVLLWSIATGSLAVEPKPPSTFKLVASDHTEALIQRDEYGVPHIFARTNRALFEAYGYAVAQDRLWQLEVNRRAARGRLAELFGPDALPADVYVRTTGYTDAELDAQFKRLSAEEQELFQAYADGINRYLTEVVLPDPLAKLPFEFHALRFQPAPWTIRDSVALSTFMIRRFGENGGREGTNLQLLASLIARHGPFAGYAIFNDVRWLNDPETPVTIPPGAAPVRPQAPLPGSPRAEQLRDAPEAWHPPEDEARALWKRYGVPTRLGSYGWVVARARSAEGAPMLYGGPQMGFNAPELVHEVQLTGGRGFNVTGMAIAGTPPVLIGRNDHIAWTSTTGVGDNLDLYIEVLCNAGAGQDSGYLFKWRCLPFDTRVEEILIKGQAPQKLTVRRSLHGPVVMSQGPVAVTQKRAHWQREVEAVSSFLGFDRSNDVREFRAAMTRIITSHNFLYADTAGNIAYWQAGQVPVRPALFDPRLPLPGIGIAEWPGGSLPVPTSINPAQGYLANWNTKPTVDFRVSDDWLLGKQDKVLEIDQRLASGTISLGDMRDIPKDIARVRGPLGREARFLRPYLLSALQVVPPSHPAAARARDVLAAWDENLFQDAIHSTTVEAGEVIFQTWLDRMLADTFSDELGDKVGEAGVDMLIHVLDQAMTGHSGVPPSRDYFNGVSPRVVMSSAFDEAVAGLAVQFGDDPATWTIPRPPIEFNHPLLGTVATIPASNRATYGQIVVLDPSGIRSENIFTLGQSGFIRFVPPSGHELDPHFMDLLPLYREFEYKPLRLLPGSAVQK